VKSFILRFYPLHINNKYVCFFKICVIQYGNYSFQLINPLTQDEFSCFTWICFFLEKLNEYDTRLVIGNISLHHCAQNRNKTLDCNQKKAYICPSRFSTLSGCTVYPTAWISIYIHSILWNEFESFMPSWKANQKKYYKILFCN
jgi:hypothetical protein